MPKCACTDDTSTTEPLRCRSDGRQAWRPWKAPPRLTASWRSHSAGVVRSSGLTFTVKALHTNASTPSLSSTALRHVSGSLTSPLTSTSPVRSMPITRYPSPVRRSAVAAPIPAAAPDTTAHFMQVLLVDLDEGSFHEPGVHEGHLH